MGSFHESGNGTDYDAMGDNFPYQFHESGNGTDYDAMGDNFPYQFYRLRRDGR
jgi:hypothetical protein